MPGRWITLHAGILLVGSAWALGGRAGWAEEVMAVIAWSAALPGLRSLYSRWRWNREARAFAFARGRPLHPSHVRSCLHHLWLLSPWMMLCVLLVISLLNPSYEPIDYALGGGFRQIAHIPYLPTTVNVARTAEKAALLSGLMVLAVTFYHLVERRDDLRLLLTAVFVNGLVLSLLGTVCELSETERILGLVEPVNRQFFASFTYANHWSAFAILGICVGLGLYEDHRDRRQRKAGSSLRTNPAPFFLAMVFFYALTIPLSGSRAGMLILVILGGLVFYRFGIARSRTGNRRRFLGTLTRVSITAAALVGVCALAFYIAQRPIEERWEKTERQWQALMEANKIDMRFHSAPRDTWKMGKEKPVWGWGLGSFVHVFPVFAGPAFATREGTIMRMEFAHNDWLQNWAELGTVGSLALIAVPAGLTVRVLRAKRARPPVTTWLLTGLFLILFLATFEFPFSNAAVLAHVFVLATAALRYPSLPRG